MFMKRKKILSWSLAMAISLLLCGGGISYAKVTGVCSNCHTMHNSQDGAALASGPNELLLIGGCVGCHTGTNDGGATPYVMSTIIPNYGDNTLAGGNFWWVSTDCAGEHCGDAKGHNVLGIATQDTNLAAAPGAEVLCANSCHLSLAVAQTAESTMGSGCQGCHLNVMHHADDSSGYVDASPWYRFLSGHSSGAGQGVKGIEDSDWQFTKGFGDHNEYLGYVGDKDGPYGLDDYTMTGFCCGCHGNFHEQDASAGGASPWLRHPSDFVIPNSGEYASMSTSYNVNTPVARSAASMTALGGAPGSTVAAGTDMVMCLSCHVAHGSPNDDMLRWNYSTIDAGGGSNTTGCFVCHTTKDD